MLPLTRLLQPPPSPLLLPIILVKLPITTTPNVRVGVIGVATALTMGNGGRGRGSNNTSERGTQHQSLTTGGQGSCTVVVCELCFSPSHTAPYCPYYFPVVAQASSTLGHNALTTIQSVKLMMLFGTLTRLPPLT